ncbi:MAG: hypothetical protein ABW061_28040 [Polyangiaceae bacterium]
MNAPLGLSFGKRHGNAVAALREALLRQVVTAEVGDTVRVVLRDEHRRLVKLVEVWMRNVRTALLKQDIPGDAGSLVHAAE